MSLTLARLCGEWRLVGENYEVWKRKIRSSNSDLSYSNRRLFVFQPPNILSRNIAISSGKYEARIAIFRIFAAINRFSRLFLRKWKAFEENRKAVSESRKPVKKSESRWRNRKAVEEDFLGFLGNEKAVEENWTLSEENRVLRKDFARKIGSYERIL